MPRPAAPVLLTAALATACAPELDWRELQPAGRAGPALLAPCRMNAQERELTLAGRRLIWTLHVCDAGAATFALGWGEVGDPAAVPTALAALRASASGNAGAQPAATMPLAVPGATPQPGAAREQFQRIRPDGSTLHMDVATFARGTRVYQATVIGGGTAGDAAQAYLSSLRFVP